MTFKPLSSRALGKFCKARRRKSMLRKCLKQKPRESKFENIAASWSPPRPPGPPARRGGVLLKEDKRPASLHCMKLRFPSSATVPFGTQWSVHNPLGWFCGPGLGSGSGTGFLSLKGSQGVATDPCRMTFFHVFFVTHFPTL